MSSKPTLGYWPIRGLAEPIRYLLAYAGIDYESKIYTAPEEWFAKDKLDGLGLHFPNLPYWIDGDVKLTQTLAILRHLGSQTGLDGSSESEKNAIALVEQQVADLFKSTVNIAYNPNWESLKVEHLKTLPSQLKLLSDFLAGKPYVAGPAISYVDFWLAEYLRRISVLVPGALAETPKLGAFLLRIERLPQLANYFRSAEPRLLNGPTAYWNGSA